MRAETVSTHRGGMWAWLFQRITAVLLIVCLAIHLILTHLFNIGQIDTENIGARWRNGGLTRRRHHPAGGRHLPRAERPAHGADGLLVHRPQPGPRLTAGLWVVGLAFLGYGIWALWPWIG